MTCELRPRVVLPAAGPPHEPADTPFGQPCAFQHWPGVPIKALISADDRFFPAGFQRCLAKGRLGIDADEIPPGTWSRSATRSASPAACTITLANGQRLVRRRRAEPPAKPAEVPRSVGLWMLARALWPARGTVGRKE